MTPLLHIIAQTLENLDGIENRPRVYEDDAAMIMELIRAYFSDPNLVHINMLQGALAKPTPVQIMHLYPTFAQLMKTVSELVADMKDEIEGKYRETKDHPAMARRYERDLASVK